MICDTRERIDEHNLLIHTSSKMAGPETPNSGPVPDIKHTITVRESKEETVGREKREKGLTLKGILLLFTTSPSL